VRVRVTLYLGRGLKQRTRQSNFCYEQKSVRVRARGSVYVCVCVLCVFAETSRLRVRARVRTRERKFLGGRGVSRWEVGVGCGNKPELVRPCAEGPEHRAKATHEADTRRCERETETGIREGVCVCVSVCLRVCEAEG